MKKLMTVIAVVFAASAAQAGFWGKLKEKFKNPGETMTWEQIHKQHGLYIPATPSIGGISIFNACDLGNGYVQSVKPISKCAEYIDVLEDDEERYELNPRTRKSCVRWKKVNRKAAAVKSQCANWIFVDRNHPDFDIYRDFLPDTDGYDKDLTCERDPETGKVLTTKVPVSMTYKLAVYRDIDADGAKTYVDDSDILAFNKDYTIPMCEEAVEPVPGKKN